MQMRQLQIDHQPLEEKYPDDNDLDVVSGQGWKQDSDIMHAAPSNHSPTFGLSFNSVFIYFPVRKRMRNN